MTPRTISLICVFLPLICVHLTWSIGTFMGNLKPCIVYWSECHSISATGRQYPEFFFFKGLMLPVAVFMAFYWWLLKHWLIQVIGDGHKRNGLWIQGLIASIALIVYTVTLGAEGEPYKLARRTGIVFFFVLSSFAHLHLLAILSKQTVLIQQFFSEYRLLYHLCALLVLSGIISGLLGYLWEGWDAWENTFEWCYALVMISLFYLVGRMWHRTGYAFSVEIKNSRA